MARLQLSIPPHLLAELKKEAAQKDITLPTLVRMLLSEHVWRRKNKKDKQSWLEKIYAGKPRRKIRSFEDLFSD